MKESNRRSFLRKILTLTASAGVAGLLLDRIPGRSVIQPVQAQTTMDIDTTNTGAATTSLSSPGNPALTATNTGSGAALQGTCTAGTGVLGTTTTGTGVQGLASGSGTALAGFAGAASAIPIVAQGSSGQTANLQEWRGSSGGLNAINRFGWIGIGTTSPQRSIQINDVNPTMGFKESADGKGWAFYSYGGDSWRMFEYFDSGWSTGADRFTIKRGGNVGIGTTSPTERLHVAGNVKCASIIPGDIVFANGVRATEDGTGLAFKNDAREKIAVLDRDGNFRVKGKLMQDSNL